MQNFKQIKKIIQLPNKSQLNLILDIVLDFLLDCYIFWSMRILLMFKLGITIKKILNVYGVNLLVYLSNENAFLIEYAESKIFTLRKENAIMKRCLKKEDNLKSLRPNLIFEFFDIFEKRNIYEEQFAKMAKNHRENEIKKMKKPIF